MSIISEKGSSFKMNFKEKKVRKTKSKMTFIDKSREWLMLKRK